jgi:archaellum biogenesis ATPase FlaH|tara:strand:+ start:3933 stop:5315 length:1383 start_codon:yes stop_codon:yes gene_type:complete
MILKQFFTNDAFMRKVVPFMDPAYFEGTHQFLFKEYVQYVAKYNNLPSQESFRISLKESENPASDQIFEHAIDILPDLFTEDKLTDPAWLLENTEKWCQDRALFNAVMESISIIDGKHQTMTKNALPEILSKALAVTFDTNVGHDYLSNADARYDFYHRVEERVPFDIEYLNVITKGGLPRKSLNVILAGTGVGKSLFMCHAAAAALSQGKNALYITMEMAEERIAERIDANLLDVSLDKITDLSRETFTSKVDKIAAKTHGKLIIKEYPTSQAHAGHFRALLNELKLKKKFVPDIIYIDYLNICGSSRIKQGGSVNSYTFIKSIAEELRGLAVEFNLPVMTATQTTRSGFGNSDIGLEDTSESFGLPATADLMLALISNDELKSLGQIMVKTLKNRYADPGMHERFVVGVDRSKMKLYDIDPEDQTLMNDGAGKAAEDTGPIFDLTTAGKKIASEGFKM